MPEAKTLEAYFGRTNPPIEQVKKFVSRVSRYSSDPVKAEALGFSIVETSYRIDDNLSRSPLHIQLANYKNLVRLAKIYGEEHIYMLTRLEKLVKVEQFIPPFGKLIAEVKERIEKKGRPPSLSKDNKNRIPFNEMIYKLLPLGRKIHQEREEINSGASREAIEERTKRELRFKRNLVTFGTGKYEN